MGVDFAGITIRAQRTRWGSCSRGSLSFNCLLMLAPPEVREYVAVHELCHRKQMNHSAAFWREVASCLPDYAARSAPGCGSMARPCLAACRKRLRQHRIYSSSAFAGHFSPLHRFEKFEVHKVFLQFQTSIWNKIPR